jgi:hypothetical protein
MMAWITTATLLVNIGLCIWYCFGMWRLQRLLKHAYELDQMLAFLCAQAFTNHQLPLWKAWSGVMGTFEVEFIQKRQMPRGD